jgi:hypothetical protein
VSEALVFLVLGTMGLVAAFVERRDGLRFAEYQARTDAEVAALRERVATLELRVRNPRWS